MQYLLNISYLFIQYQSYLPEVSNIQLREEELKIVLTRVKNFDITQKSSWNICFII